MTSMHLSDWNLPSDSDTSRCSETSLPSFSSDFFVPPSSSSSSSSFSSCLRNASLVLLAAGSTALTTSQRSRSLAPRASRWLARRKILLLLLPEDAMALSSAILGESGAAESMMIHLLSLAQFCTRVLRSLSAPGAIRGRPSSSPDTIQSFNEINLGLVVLSLRASQKSRSMEGICELTSAGSFKMKVGRTEEARSNAVAVDSSSVISKEMASEAERRNSWLRRLCSLEAAKSTTSISSFQSSPRSRASSNASMIFGSSSAETSDTAAPNTARCGRKSLWSERTSLATHCRDTSAHRTSIGCSLPSSSLNT